MRALVGQLGIGVILVAVAGFFFSLHDYGGMRMPPTRDITMAAVLLLAWLAMTVGMTVGKTRERAAMSTHAPDAVLVVHASQTGFAAELAARTASTLCAGGCRVDACGIDALTPRMLAEARRVLFIASTTGEGDAPDMATGFRRSVMATPLALTHLEHGVLALGDHDYDDFCAFGHDLARWLHASGSVAAFDLVEVDNGDAGALRHWQHRIGQWAGTADAPDWERPAYQPWRLAERRLLNPGSVGGPCYHVALVPVDPAHLAWEAGDLVETGPRRHRDDTVVHTHREYSIASIPADGALHLVVRLRRDASGQPGLGSGWLTTVAEPGDTVALRVRRNEGFHAPADDRPLLLVGNGTGIAGLRALLKQRIARGHRRNWLIYGERQAGVDRLHVDELERWRDEGGIERLDLVWSREPAGPRHVQDRLREVADELRRFIDAGAAVYVCGSLAGMAPGVDAALRDVLGEPAVETLLAQGRYRRDVY